MTPTILRLQKSRTEALIFYIPLERALHKNTGQLHTQYTRQKWISTIELLEILSKWISILLLYNVRLLILSPLSDP